MAYIQKVNTELSRIEFWRVVTDDLLVIFKHPLTKFQDKVYNETLPGTTHTLVREFNRKERKVRFWSCEVEEFKDSVSLGFPWYDEPHHSSTGISFRRADIVRMVRRGMRAERIPNPRCWTCSRRESDWHAAYRLEKGRAYDPTRNFKVRGIRYHSGWWYCNACLEKDRARGDRGIIDVFIPRRERVALLSRIQSSPLVAAAMAAEQRVARARTRTMRRLLKLQKRFWTREQQGYARLHSKFARLCKGRTIPAEVQKVLDQFKTWTSESRREQERCSEQLKHWSEQS